MLGVVKSDSPTEGRLLQLPNSPSNPQQGHTHRRMYTTYTQLSAQINTQLSCTNDLICSLL